MYSIRVVPGLDVFEYRKCGLEPGSVLFVIYPFHLEILEEAFFPSYLAKKGFQSNGFMLNIRGIDKLEQRTGSITIRVSL